jgi:hypothetical protein
MDTARAPWNDVLVWLALLFAFSPLLSDLWAHVRTHLWAAGSLELALLLVLLPEETPPTRRHALTSVVIGNCGLGALSPKPERNASVECDDARPCGQRWCSGCLMHFAPPLNPLGVPSAPVLHPKRACAEAAQLQTWPEPILDGLVRRPHAGTVLGGRAPSVLWWGLLPAAIEHPANDHAARGKQPKRGGLGYGSGREVLAHGGRLGSKEQDKSESGNVAHAFPPSARGRSCEVSVPER